MAETWASAGDRDAVHRVRLTRSQRQTMIPPRSQPKWRNWQTRWIQNPVIAISCGFESHLRHLFPISDRQLLEIQGEDELRSAVHKAIGPTGPTQFGCGSPSPILYVLYEPWRNFRFRLVSQPKTLGIEHTFADEHQTGHTSYSSPGDADLWA